MRKNIEMGIAILLMLAFEPRWALAGGGQKQTAGKPKAGPVAATLDADYVIGPDDMLAISVWKEPDVSVTIPVRPDGKISLPLLNDVEAAGLTPMQLETNITDGLKKFITDPRVTVIVTQINSRRVYVLGEVARPGPFAMYPNMTVLQALSAAGGVTQFAKVTAIYILRNEKGQQTTLPFNYKEVVRGRRGQQNILLKPGDTIVVP
jgi:polysaccharide biosynthesis/export protein